MPLAVRQKSVTIVSICLYTKPALDEQTDRQTEMVLTISRARYKKKTGKRGVY